VIDREQSLERLRGAPARAIAWTASTIDAPGEGWSPHQVMRHLLTVERVVWHVRLDQLAAGEQPRWAYAEPGTGGADDRALTTLLEEFAAARDATIDRLTALDDAGWARTGIHERYGVLDVAALCRLAADHDDEHLAD
jgi:hypothetical protein